MIIKALRAMLLADAEIVAAFGSRIYPRLLPQSPTLPALVLHLISTSSGMINTGRDGVDRRRVQVDCWAARYEDAETLANLVKRTLDGGRGTYAGERINTVSCVQEADLGPGARGDDEVGPGLPLPGRRLDFTLLHMEV